jgi:hypothetical protein
MHLIYSALRDQTKNPNQPKTELTLRYYAYLEACKKHKDTIAEIQKHFPSWTPRFR